MLRQLVHFGSLAGSGQISSYCAGIAGDVRCKGFG